MREVVFHVLAERTGQLEAEATAPAIHITAPTLEELQHEAREALIRQLGAVHGTYRVRIRRQRHQPLQPRGIRAIQPLRRQPTA